MRLKSAINAYQFEILKSRLYQEWEGTGSGFYSNIKSIEKSFIQNRILGFEYIGELIGFITWHENIEEHGSYLDLNIMTIHHDFRFKGFGKKFYKLAESYFAEKGFLFIKLFCAPAESQFFWEKMVFFKYPDIDSENELTYFKPLIPYNKSTTERTSHLIELWDTGKYYAQQRDPKWIWNIDEKFKAIIHPASPEWFLRLTLNSRIVKEEEVKYFTSERDELRLVNFLYINKEKLDWLIKEFGDSI